MQRLPRALGLAAAACASVLVLAGCGHDTAPGDAAPALARQLDDVDAAVGAHDYAAARSALKGLVRETTRARDDGTIDGDQADAILQAASAVLEQLPGGTTASTTTPSPTPTPDDAATSAAPTPTPTPGGEDAGQQEPKPEKPKKPEPPKPKGPKDEHGPGHDHGHHH